MHPPPLFPKLEIRSGDGGRKMGQNVQSLSGTLRKETPRLSGWFDRPWFYNLNLLAILANLPARRPVFYLIMFLFQTCCAVGNPFEITANVMGKITHAVATKYKVTKSDYPPSKFPTAGE